MMMLLVTIIVWMLIWVLEWRLSKSDAVPLPHCANFFKLHTVGKYNTHV